MTTLGYRSQFLQPAISNEDLLAFLNNDESAHARTLYIGNMDCQVTRKLLYELMLQAGPVESIRIVTPREGSTKTFAFVVFEHAVSVRYAMLVFQDLSLFRSRLSLNYSGGHKNKPRTVYPPYPPTFFEMPAGFEETSEAVRRQIIPPPHYRTGYFIQPTLNSKVLDYSEELELSASYQYQRNEEGLPPAKRMRGDPAGDAVPPEIRNGYGNPALQRNGYSDPALQQRNGYQYPPVEAPPPPPHPYGQYPPPPPGNGPSYPPQQHQQHHQQPQYYYPPSNSTGLLQAPPPQPNYGYSQQGYGYPPHQQQPNQPAWVQPPALPPQRSLSAGQADPYQYQARPPPPQNFSPQGQWR